MRISSEGNHWNQQYNSYQSEDEPIPCYEASLLYLLLYSLQYKRQLTDEGEESGERSKVADLSEMEGKLMMWFISNNNTASIEDKEKEEAADDQ